MKHLHFKLASVLLSIALPSLSQKAANNIEIKRNTVFIEAGGNALFYSINYDRQLKLADQWRLAGRIGIMYLNTFTNQNRNLVGIPIEFSYLKGTKNNFFEVGVGFTGIYDQYYSSFDPRIPIRDGQVKDLAMMAILRIGYRHQKKEGGLFYKIGLTPLAGYVFDVRKNSNKTNPENFAYPWIGAAIGWTLKG